MVLKKGSGQKLEGLWGKCQWKPVEAFVEAAGKSLQEVEDSTTETWRKEEPPYRIAASLAVLSPLITWEIENIPNELGDPVKEISRQRGEGATSLLLLYIEKCKQRKAKGKTNKTEPRIVEFKNSQPLQMTCNAKIKKWLLGKDQI